MPVYTTKLGLPKPSGAELVSRANHNALVDAIDAGAAAQAQVDQPFYLKSTAYDQAGNQITLTLGSGRASFLGTLVSLATDTTHAIVAPAINTTYTVYIQSNGTFTHNTTGAETAGAVPIWRVATGAVVTAITTTDLRGQLTGAAAQVVQDHLDAHEADPDPHPQYATDGDLANHVSSNQAHGAGAGQYVAVTSRTDQKPAWGDIPDKPSTYMPSAHASTHKTGSGDALSPADIGAAAATHAAQHKTGGGDPLAPADIGAETPTGAQAKADADLEEALVIQGAFPVTGEEPGQVDVATYGPAIEFADGVTQSIDFNVRWPFATANATITLELVIAMDTANAGGVRLQAVSYLNGATATTTPWTVTPGSVTTLVTMTQAIRATESVAHGALLTIKLSRLGADAADTHTGKMRLFQTRVKRG